MSQVFAAEISREAILGWQQRVDSQADSGTAEWAIRRFLLTGRPQSDPQDWMKQEVGGRGVQYVYARDYPDVCVVIKQRSAVAVVTADSLQPLRPAGHPSAG